MIANVSENGWLVGWLVGDWLAGGHSVGRAHCVSFKARLYPTLDRRLTPQFAKKLLDRCPKKIPLHTRFNPVHFTYIRNDPFSPLTLDNHYFQELLRRHGVMKVDDNLIWDPRTLPYVKLYAKDASAWKKTLLVAYQKLSEYKVLTGTQGEIRRKCALNKK
jgi:peroxidase